MKQIAEVFVKNHVKLLGDPILRRVSLDVRDIQDEFQNIKLLQKTLQMFKQAYSFGRGIAAPQIGVTKKIIALDIYNIQFPIINPEIVDRSKEQFTMWDDCMSFPFILVRVLRNRSISVKFQDVQGNNHILENLPIDISELLQHEIDHLNGILAVDHAYKLASNSNQTSLENLDSLVSKEVYESMIKYNSQQVVDYYPACDILNIDPQFKEKSEKLYKYILKNKQVLMLKQ